MSEEGAAAVEEDPPGSFGVGSSGRVVAEFLVVGLYAPHLEGTQASSVGPVGAAVRARWAEPEGAWNHGSEV